MTIVHVVTVEDGRVGGHLLTYRASCSCGWVGSDFTARAPAQKEQRQHRVESRSPEMVDA